MIVKKELSAPAFTARSVRRKISLFGEESGAISAGGIHFRQRDGKIVCAEGIEPIGEYAATLMVSGGHAAVRMDVLPPVIEAPAEELVFPFSQKPNAIFCFTAKDGEQIFLAATDGGCYRLERSHASAAGEGGKCGAVHGERLFLADGSRLSWSAPLDPTDREQAAQGAGHVDLPSADGEILSVVSLKEELFLFRERGIARLDVKGDTRNFSAEHIPFAGGSIRAGSVQKCGDVVRFLTENGLYSFNGERCVRLRHCGTSRLDTENAVTAACGGNYYATVKYCGEACIWCVDEEERGHLIRAKAEQLAGGERLLFVEGGVLYGLTPRGLPASHRQECVLTAERSLFGLSARPKYLDGIVVEGKGHFRVEARGERGLPRAVFGRAGEKLRFPMPVRGCGFSLELRTIEENAEVGAVVLEIREEARRW